MAKKRRKRSSSFVRALSAALILVALALPSARSEVRNPAARTHLEQAQKLLREKNLDAALAEAEAGLKLDPRSVEGLDLVGIIHVAKQDYDRAFEVFAQALKIDPHSGLTLNSLGNAYLAQGKSELAEKEFRATLFYHPADRDANYNLGLLLLSRKEARAALVYLNRVRPPDSEVLTNLARAYFAAGQKAKGLEVAKSLSEEAKNDVRAHFTLGILLASQKLYPEAIHEFELADVLKPGTFEVLHNLGEAWLKAGDATKAEDVLERACRLNPGSPETLYILAQADADQGKNVQALELLVEAHKLAPENTDIIFLLARMSMVLDYFDDAIQVLEEGVKIAPRRADLHAALGESYFTVGKIDRAQQEFRTLIELDHSARSYAFMGLNYRHQGQFEEAKKYFKEGLTKDPRNAQCLFNLGFIEHKQGNNAQAEKYLAAAIASFPDYDNALYEMAGVKMSEKKYAEAIPLLRRAARLLPRPAEAYYKLATAERNLHQTEAAQRDLKVFETLSKDPKPAPYPLQHLFDFVGQRAKLPPQERAELDLEELQKEAQRRTGRPKTLYLLAEAYFKRGRNDEALQAVAQLDQVSGGDARTALGIGVLLARFGQYAQAIEHFQTALAADPTSDDARYNLANAFFQVGEYQIALESLQSISEDAQKDDTYLVLLGDTYMHLGRAADAIPVLKKAIRDSPDNDLYYLSLALAEIRAGDLDEATKALNEGLAHVPDSGQLCWGMGVAFVLRGDNERAETYLKKAVDLMPTRESAYGTLGIFYYEAGRFNEAREVLQRYSAVFPNGRFDTSRIREALSRAPASETSPRAMASLSPQARKELLQLAFFLAEGER